MFHVSTLLPYSEENKQQVGLINFLVFCFSLSSTYSLSHTHTHTLTYMHQLERKRHIGNDIVVIIFVDYDTDPELAITSVMHFDPCCMKSHFNHIFALVTYNDQKNQYQLTIHSAVSVPEFGPLLPPEGKFSNRTKFREFLLAKCKHLHVHPELELLQCTAIQYNIII